MFNLVQTIVRVAALGVILGAPAFAQAVKTDPQKSATSHQISIPAGSLADALDRLVAQAGVQILYEPALADGLKVPALAGTLTFRAALDKLLGETNLTAESVNDKTVVLRRVRPATSGVAPADQMRLAAADTSQGASGKDAGKEAVQMVVEGARDARGPMAGGNMDLARSEDGPLPYKVFDRAEIVRSGMVDLNAFLQQNLLEGDASVLSAGQTVSSASSGYVDSSDNNLNLRGFGVNQTIVLVNGRRMPRTIAGAGVGSSDLGGIPISMIERVEILPASASAIYGDSAVGGVINVILRPDFRISELGLTYNNAAAGFEAPQSSASLVYGGNVLGGRMQYRLSGSFTKTVPPTEAQLGHLRRETALDQVLSPPALTVDVFGATPNIRSANGSPLFGPGTPSVTSVAPDADGTGGLAAFAGRQGVRNLDLYDAPGRFAYGRSVDTTYGQAREQGSYSGSLTYQANPWLELSLSASLADNRRQPGFSIISHSATVPASSPFNPFGQAVIVSLYEVPSAWGEGFARSTASTEMWALGALVKLPHQWSLSADAQYSESSTHYQLAISLPSVFNTVIASGLYNPFRDTQVYGPPDIYYQEAPRYFVPPGETDPGKGIHLGIFSSTEYSLRLTNLSLALPTGRGTLVFGGNYYYTDLEGWNRVQRNLSGSSVITSVGSGAGSVYQWGVYAELHAPLLPQHWLPAGVRALEGNIAYRHAGSSAFKQASNPPTVGVRLDLAGGLSLRGTHTSAYRPPSAEQTLLTSDPVPTTPNITDPLRGNEQYAIEYVGAANPDLLPEDASTVSLGLAWQVGTKHRLRVAVDYLHTDKTNEFTNFTTVSALTNEQYYPERVQRETPAPGDPYGIGRVTFIRGGPINVLGRDSENWTGSVRYAWKAPGGGVLEAGVNGFYFESFRTQLLPTAPVVENIENPDGSFTGLLKYRATAGLLWSPRELVSFGMDGRYYHPRMLPRNQWAGQGSRRVESYTEFDVFMQGEISNLVPLKMLDDVGLRAQLRINNIFDSSFPFNRAALGDVQAYGDWRGRVYSLSLTAMF